jgi:hypothetical protein
MTRKHFNALAAALRDAWNSNTSADSVSARQAWEQAVIAVADVRSASNASFKRERFYAACGLDEQSTGTVHAGSRLINLDGFTYCTTAPERVTHD